VTASTPTITRAGHTVVEVRSPTRGCRAPVRARAACGFLRCPVGILLNQPGDASTGAASGWVPASPHPTAMHLLPVQVAFPPLAQVMVQGAPVPVQRNAQVEPASQTTPHPPPEQSKLQDEPLSQSVVQLPPVHVKVASPPMSASRVQPPLGHAALHLLPKHSTAQPASHA
jgi:hypothetical protein